MTGFGIGELKADGGLEADGRSPPEQRFASRPRGPREAGRRARCCGAALGGVGRSVTEEALDTAGKG